MKIVELPEQVPDNMKGIKEYLGNHRYTSEVNEEEYAKIAFILLNLITEKEPNKSNLKEIADYIQRQHGALRAAYKANYEIVSTLSSFLERANKEKGG